jgi:superfamily II DNA/RNA helicase
MTDRVNELAAVSLRKPVKIFVDSNKTVAWNLQQEFVRIRPSQEPHQVRGRDLLVNPESTDPQ